VTEDNEVHMEQECALLNISTWLYERDVMQWSPILRYPTFGRYIACTLRSCQSVSPACGLRPRQQTSELHICTFYLIDMIDCHSNPS
jgi:hypothetical protein